MENFADPAMYLTQIHADFLVISAVWSLYHVGGGLQYIAAEILANITTINTAYHFTKMFAQFGTSNTTKLDNGPNLRTNGLTLLKILKIAHLVGTCHFSFTDHPVKFCLLRQNL